MHNKLEVEFRNSNDVPVDSVRARNRRKFGVAAMRAGSFDDFQKFLTMM